MAAHLICSRSSSIIIHKNILGYHVCKYSDKTTQDGGKFVRNLVDMISRRVPEYGRVIANSHWIQKALQYDSCSRNPQDCFEESILIPFRELKFKVDRLYFIVVDALDECVVDASNDAGQSISGSIVRLIRDKISRLPKWLKFVVTSRNDSSIFKYFENTFMINLRALDQRNLDDIESYLTRKISAQDGSFPRSFQTLFGISQDNKFVSTLLKQSQGNFLFVRQMLHFVQTDSSYTGQWSVPSSLGGIYEDYFQRAYGSMEKFRQVRNILEIMVSSFVPMSENEMFEALSLQDLHLDREYDFMFNLKSLEHFIRYGENNTLSLFHLSFVEWLTDDSNRGSTFYVNKRRGHSVLADYHFKIVSKPCDEADLLGNVFRLARHIAFGEANSNRSIEFSRLHSVMFNTSTDESERTLLHLASSVRNVKVLRILLPHFSKMDGQDSHGFTPAFVAAMNGILENVAFLASQGANVNHKTPPPPKPPYLSLQDPILASKSALWSSSLLHVASQGGHVQLVKFLLEQNASSLETNALNLTALHIAAEHGHLEVVRILRERGGQVDQLALHHAAKNGHAAVVQYLLQAGVKDECMRCDGSFYWLDGEERYQGLSMLSMRSNHTLFPIWEKWMSVRRTCLNSITNYKFVDDKHMIFCETALHAAVSSGHYEVTGILLSQDDNAIHCTDYAGRTPLHESVRKNNLQSLQRLLLANANVKFKCNSFQNLSRFSNVGEMMRSAHTNFKYINPSEEQLHEADKCPCGSTPLHVAARYGHIQAAALLRKHGASVYARDCQGATPLHTAACHGHHKFLKWLLESIPSIDINMPSTNGSSPIHSAAICGMHEEVAQLVSMGANWSHVDENGMSALHYAVLFRGRGKDEDHLDYSAPPSTAFTKEYFSSTLFGMWMTEEDVMYEYKFPENTLEGNSVFDRQCRTVKTLVELVNKRQVNRPDNNGTTALHLAAQNGLECAAGILIANGGDSFVQNGALKTPFDFAMENTNFRDFCSEQSNSLWQLRKMLDRNLRDHIAVVHILLSANTQFHFGCAGEKATLLHRAIEKRQPYIVLLLLLLGADVRCKDAMGRTPLLVYLQNAGKWTDMILNSYTKVAITCGVPFNKSELHLLAYRAPSSQANNFFYIRVPNFQTSSFIPGPLVNAIEAHPLRYKLLSSCRDAEGYTPLHRAAQGGNLVAIKEFLSRGAKPDELTPHKQNALTLAVQYSRPGSNTELRSNISLLLYKAMTKSNTFEIKCDINRRKLTIYHLAAYRGLERFLKTFLSEQLAQGLDIDCPDKYGITPLYLAKLHAGSFKEKGEANPWDNVVRLIESHGGKLHLPRRDAELRLLYTHLYGNCMEPVNHELLETLNVLSNASLVRHCTSHFFERHKREGKKEWPDPLFMVTEEVVRLQRELSTTTLRSKIFKELTLKMFDELLSLRSLWELSNKQHKDWENEEISLKVAEAIDDDFFGYQKLLKKNELNLRNVKTTRKEFTKSCRNLFGLVRFARSYVTGVSTIISKYKMVLPSKHFENIDKRIITFEAEDPCYRMFTHVRPLGILLQLHFISCSCVDISINGLKDTAFFKSRAPTILLHYGTPKFMSEVDISWTKDISFLVKVMSKQTSKFDYLQSITLMEDESLRFILQPEGLRNLKELGTSVRFLRNIVNELRKSISPLVLAAQEKSLHKIWNADMVKCLIQHT